MFLHYLKKLLQVGKVCADSLSDTLWQHRVSLLLHPAYCLVHKNNICLACDKKVLGYSLGEAGDVYMLCAISLRLQKTVNVIPLNFAMLEEKNMQACMPLTIASSSLSPKTARGHALGLLDLIVLYFYTQKFRSAVCFFP